MYVQKNRLENFLNMSTMHPKFSIHHIGGRAGSRAFPVYPCFESDIVNVLYDADTDCVEQIQQANQKLDSKLYVLPYCLGEKTGWTTLNINYDPYTSSLYEPNSDYNDYYNFYKTFDYPFAETIRVVEKRNVGMNSLDHIFSTQPMAAPPPDFLSIDTQGSEYDILMGAKELLKSNILGLILEAEFHPIYKGQKLFGDLTQLLNAQGFHFAHFLEMGEMSPMRAPLGLRGDGFHLFSEVLFLKRIDDVAKNKSDNERWVALRKLAFIAFVFNQFEYGLACLQKSEGIKSVQKEAAGMPNYFRFLSEIESVIAEAPKDFPSTFLNVYPDFQKSKARFEVKKDVSKSWRQGLKLFLSNQAPASFKILKFMRKIKNEFLSFSKKIMLHLKILFAGSSSVEKLFLRYGLKTQAKILKTKRILQTSSSRIR